MNERTKELLLQAALEALKEEPTDYIACDLLKVEKFADLIVRECIDIISPYAMRMENFDGGHPIADIKKHFGVK